MVDSRGVRVIELVLIGIAALGLLAAIGDRLLDREIVAMVFVCFNNLAHLALQLSLLAWSSGALAGDTLVDPSRESAALATTTSHVVCSEQEGDHDRRARPARTRTKNGFGWVADLAQAPQL